MSAVTPSLVVMPCAESGRVMDPFGHTWGLGQQVEDVSDEEMQRRMASF